MAAAIETGDAAVWDARSEAELGTFILRYLRDFPPPEGAQLADPLRAQGAKFSKRGRNQLQALMVPTALVPPLPRDYVWPNGRAISGVGPLSAREVEVLTLFTEGETYRAIAENLTLAVSTVRTHAHNIYMKLGAANRAQAVLIAVSRGYVRPVGTASPIDGEGE